MGTQARQAIVPIPSGRLLFGAGSYSGRSLATPPTGPVARQSPVRPALSAASAMAPAAARRKRASKPKVRTGCKTCKIRRIKCDETKPHCRRCTSTGRTCDGYEFPPVSVAGAVTNRPSPPSRAASHYQSIFLPTSISKPFAGSVQERRIFHRFQFCTVPFFTGGSETGFWTNLVLKVGQEEPIVRQAIIALGTLHEDYQDRRGKYSEQVYQEESHQQAVALYSAALRELNCKLNERSRKNAKLAIIASILFACIEVLRRNNMAAVVHYQTGMRELIRQMNLPAQDGSLPPYSPEEYQASRAAFREMPQSELDEMLRVFARYDIQACTFSKDTAERLDIRMSPVPRVLPTALTLNQVRTHLDNLLVAVYQLIKSDAQMYRYWRAENVPIEWHSRREEAINVFDGWMVALEKHFHEQAQSLTPSQIKNLLGLRLQIKVAVIILRVSIDCAPETSFDMFQAEFESMVLEVENMTSALQLKEVLPLDAENTPFTMELGVVHPLFFVACKCRDWDLRWRAIAQLKRVGKEGVWEGPIMAVLATRLAQLEEQGLPWGTLIPERNRFHEVKKVVDYDSRLVRFEASRALDVDFVNLTIHREALAF